MAHTQTYEKPLRQVFTDDDPELAARVARVCVLFEDLQVEYWGAREEDVAALDQLSKQYRRFYFLRRSLVTLDEFGGAISELNALRSWSEWIQTHPNQEQREIWNAAIKFFGESKKRFAMFRNDIGGHYQESLPSTRSRHALLAPPVSSRSTSPILARIPRSTSRPSSSPACSLRTCPLKKSRRTPTPRVRHPDFSGGV